MDKSIVSSDIRGTKYSVPVWHLKWRPASYGIVIRDNEILLTKQRGAYHLPGGGTDLGEMPEEGAIREVREETGLTVANPRLAGCISGFFSFEYPKGAPMTHVQSILLYYALDYVEGELSTDGFMDDEKEIGELAEWVPLELLDSIMAGSTIDWRFVVKGYLAADKK